MPILKVTVRPRGEGIDAYSVHIEGVGTLPATQEQARRYLTRRNFTLVEGEQFNGVYEKEVEKLPDLEAAGERWAEEYRSQQHRID